MEIDALFEPTDGLRMGGHYTYTDAELREDVPGLIGGRAGERLPAIPKNAATIYGDYAFGLFGTDVFVGATAAYVGERDSNFDDNAANPNFVLDDYATLDLRAGFAAGPATVSVFARNVTDEVVELNAGTAPLRAVDAAGTPVLAVDRTELFVGRPRTYGLSVSTEF